MATISTSTPWFRVPVAWLVLMIPVTCVIGCMFTIYLAIANPDVVYERTPMPVEDYEQQ